MVRCDRATLVARRRLATIHKWRGSRLLPSLTVVLAITALLLRPGNLWLVPQPRPTVFAASRWILWEFRQSVRGSPEERHGAGVAEATCGAVPQPRLFSKRSGTFSRSQARGSIRRGRFGPRPRNGTMIKPFNPWPEVRQERTPVIEAHQGPRKSGASLWEDHAGQLWVSVDDFLTI
jgi:hypothetical protein